MNSTSKLLDRSLMRAASGGLLATALLALHTPTLIAQPRQLAIEGNESCEDCQITSALLVRLGKPSDPELLRESSALFLQDRFGRYFARGADLVLVLVYDSTGRYLTAIGKKGNGPLENGPVRNAFRGQADSLLVLGERGDCIIYAPDLTAVRSVKLPAATRSLRHLSDGSLLVHATVREPDGAYRSLHVVNSLGRITKSFATAGQRDNPDCVECRLRYLMPGPLPDQAWLAYSTRYEMELWDAGSGFIRRATREVPWFAPRHSDPAAQTRAQLAAALAARADTGINVGAVISDDGRILWWFFRGGAHPLGRGQIVEAVDVVSGRVLHSQRLYPELSWISSSRAFARARDSDGYAYIDVYRITLGGM